MRRSGQEVRIGMKSTISSFLGLDERSTACYNNQAGSDLGRACRTVMGRYGEMAERFKALVLKTSDVERHRGFESLSLRFQLA